MNITSKGQVTIPIELREKFGFLPYTEVEFEAEDDHILIRKKNILTNNPSQRSIDLIRKMAGKASVNMTTDDIMKLTRSS